MSERRILGEHFRADGRPKRGFENHFVADAQAREYGLVAYECSVCGRWHLASPPEPTREQRRRERG